MFKTTIFIIIGGLFFIFATFVQISQTSEKMITSNETSFPAALENPLIVIKKKARALHLYDGETLVKTYKIGLGFAPVGDKEREGDGKTPEGEFYIFTKNPKSSFYLSLGVSYPNSEDARRGLEAKLITKAQHDAIIKANREKKMPLQKTKLGGEIYIHGNGSQSDWTWGCIALDDADMKELFEMIPIGAKVVIEP